MMAVNEGAALTPERIYSSAKIHAAQRGYSIVNPQANHKGEVASELVWTFDLAGPNNPHKPKVRVFWCQKPIDNLEIKHFQAARSLTKDKTIHFISFTNDGTNYRTIATIGNSRGVIDFVPRAYHGVNNSSEVHSKSDLQPFVSIYELRQLITRLSDSIFVTYGHDRLKLFDTVLLLIAAKIYDEIQNANDLYIPRLCMKSSSNLKEEFLSFCRVALKRMNCDSFGTNLYLDDHTLRKCLEMLIPYSFSLTVDIGAQAETLGMFYQEVVSSTFRGSLGAYFTPKPVADLASVISEPLNSDFILDMSCGSGTFLLSAFSHAESERDYRHDCPKLFGCDIQERMVLTTVLNCFLHGVYKPRIIHADALRVDVNRWHILDPTLPADGFSLIVGNPPFAGFESAEFLPYYRESQAVQRRAGPKVNKVIPFIGKTVQMLRPGGRAALVIPISVLNAEALSFTNLRQWLSSEVELTEIISLPRDAFVHTDCGIKGALLFFRKKSALRGKDKVFFKKMTNLGYDRRGRTVSGSDIDETIALWKRRNSSDSCWIETEELYKLDRWDPTWIEGYINGETSYSRTTHISLTDVCMIEKRTLRMKDIDPNEIYGFFELGDADIDTGRILQTHTIKGKDLTSKIRLRVPVQEGDVLLPNHRDSLIAKTAAGTGRSCVLATNKENGCITSNRFTVLKPLIHPKLLIAILNSDLVRKQLALHARGSASFDIRDKVLEKVHIPRKFVDKKIHKKILSAIEKRERLQQLLIEADEHFRRLMNNLDN
jgi:type I restriction-modification system DNA methylase subunit